MLYWLCCIALHFNVQCVLHLRYPLGLENSKACSLEKARGLDHEKAPHHCPLLSEFGAFYILIEIKNAMVHI